MLQYLAYLVFLGAAVQLVGIYSYIKDVIRGDTKPNRVSWLLWGVTKIPEVAIVFVIASDGLAAVPTLVKSWKYPETENAGPFTAGIFSSLTSFTAYLVIINIFIALAIYRRKVFGKEEKVLK